MAERRVVGDPPDPATAASPAEFVGRLRELRFWAGEPSLRRLRQLAGTTADPRGRPVDVLPVSTISYVLRTDRLPKAEFVRAYVSACLQARGRDPDEVAEQVERWHDAWLQLHDHLPDPVAGPPALAADAAPVPRQLPAAVTGFTGREQELALLAKVLGTDERAGPATVAVIDGAGGVGKSALAIHAAHLLARAFPDGQLYVNLHGATAGLEPLEPIEVLGRLLRALGVPGQGIPATLDEAAARFRTQVAGRRLLVVLDNAAEEAQVRPLLPGTASCGALVTSRRTLTGLASTSQIHLDVLSEPEVVGLLGRLVGAERLAAEPAATAVLARRCGYLPLALRIAGARLLARPAWPVATLAGRLADARRLDELELADTGVRASFAVSFQQLRRDDPAAARTFAVLGLWDGPDVSLPVGARLLDQPERDTERLLEKLVDARLLDTTTPGRYRLHDLLRLFAREHATEACSPPEQVAILARVLRLYIATAWHATALLRPGDDRRLSLADPQWATGGITFTDPDQALAWLEAERPNLPAAAAQAAAVPELHVAATQLAQAMFRFLALRGHPQDLGRLSQVALDVARSTGDAVAEAQALSDLGFLDRYQCRYDAAVARLRESLAIWERIGDRRGQAGALSNLSIALATSGRGDEAVAYLQRAVAIGRKLGDRIYRTMFLNNLGVAYTNVGRHREALECVRESLAANQTHGDRWGEAYALDSLGVIHHTIGRYPEALTCYRESLAVFRELGALSNEAEELHQIGTTLHALGDSGQARSHWQSALAIYERLGVDTAEQVRSLLAEPSTEP